MPENKFLEELKSVWDMVKDSFREELTETTINLWFGDMEILSFEGDRITLSLSNELKFGIVKERFLSKIQEKFCRLLGFDVQVSLTYSGSAVSADQIKSNVIGMQPSPTPEAADTKKEIPIYNFEYTFENFIVGSTNKFAYATSIAVADRPATDYNPLFIYGNSGLGKTHLMSAIINRMKKNNPNVRVIYIKCEDFINHMISCITNKNMEEFRDKYRKCDVLLIDDIQFIAGKNSIQEEFFHTFNALYEEKKQIILTSDRPPRDIQRLEDRIKSRMEWGLLADIEPPDLELRIAIIKKKAEQVNVKLSDDVLTFLGENIRSNIRQIEGAIKKLGALSFLSGKEITMEVAKECISELLGGAEPVNVTVDKVFAAVYKQYGVSKEDLIGPKRNKDIAMARHITIFLIRQITEMSLPSIGKIFDREHATVISSLKVVDDRMNRDPAFVNELTDLKHEICGV
jgi:chromosomal replication initiator protein